MSSSSTNSSACPSPHIRCPLDDIIKYSTMDDIMRRAKNVETYGDEVMSESEGEEVKIDCEEDSEIIYKKVCKECGEAENEDKLPRAPIAKWFCSSCCSPDIIASRFPKEKIMEFFHIEECTERSTKDNRKRRRSSLRMNDSRKKGCLVPYIPSKDHAQRLVQMQSLAHALTVEKIRFSDELTYTESMTPRSANQAEHEDGGIQVLPKKDIQTLQRCKTMCRRGEFPPLLVVFDPYHGFTIEADDPIKKNTLLAEYTGEVDYTTNRKYDSCDTIMHLLMTNDPTADLVICADRRGNISRFISGINNNDPDSKKKQNVQGWRYSINGESRVFFVAKRKIEKGERLYLDYNGHVHDYPTEHFV